MPIAAFIAKEIKPKYWSGSDVSRQVFGALQKQGALVREDLLLTTANWRHKVVWRKFIRFAGGNILMVVETDDEIWGYLNQGTSVRYATMRKGFQRKTNPGQLRSGPGGGNPDPWFVSRNKPHKGIKAREWHNIIIQRRKAGFKQAMLRAVRTGLARKKNSP